MERWCSNFLVFGRFLLIHIFGKAFTYYFFCMVVFFFAEFYLNNRCTVYPIVLQVFSFQLIMFSILDVCVCLKLD